MFVCTVCPCVLYDCVYNVFISTARRCVQCVCVNSVFICAACLSYMAVISSKAIMTGKVRSHLHLLAKKREGKEGGEREGGGVGRTRLE